MPAERTTGQAVDIDENRKTVPAAESIGKCYDLVVQTLVDAFADRLKTVVLFGSQVRGEAGPASDHDLLVIVENLPVGPLDRRRMVRGMLLPILDRLPGLINFVAKTPQEFAANLTPLLLDIIAEWRRE